MNVLVLGGTQFIGRHVVEALLAAGHAVSVLTRGITRDPLPASVERLRGDRDSGAAGLASLGKRRWDACVDVSGYTPHQVAASTERLASAARYVFISAVSVYGDPPRGPVGEDEPRIAPARSDEAAFDGKQYGALKVACEDLVLARFGNRATLLRPQVVVGPHDPSGRYGYWVRRALQPGPMLAPGDGSDPLQVIDVRDLARFVVTALERDLRGAFNLAGPRFDWATFMRLLGAKEPVWVPAATLAAAALDFTELPLYRPAGGPRSSLMNVASARARDAGLGLSAPAETLAETQAWLLANPQAPALGLDPAREAALIRSRRH